MKHHASGVWTATILLSALPLALCGQSLPAGVTERNITVPGPVPLPGTLTLPTGRGPFPGVVLVHGSGAGDRDETMPPPSAPSKPFRDLAWGLAQHGIVVLRYDKRARVQPTWYAGKNFTVYDEAVQDAVDRLGPFCVNSQEVDPRSTFQLGHSLGAMLAPRISAADGKVAGLIIMAGATRVTLIDQMIRQVNEQFAAARPTTAEDSTRLRAQRTQIDAIFGKAKGLEAADTADNAPLPGLGGTGTRYWIDLAAYDPAITMRDLHIPALVLQGMRDYQVAPDQLEDWLKVVGTRPDITVKRYPSAQSLVHGRSGWRTWAGGLQRVRARGRASDHGYRNLDQGALSMRFILRRRMAALVAMLGVPSILCAQAAADRGAFLLRRIRYRRHRTLLAGWRHIAGTSHDAGQPRVQYAATLGPRFSIPKVTADVFGSCAADVAPLQRSRITLVPATAVSRQWCRGQPLASRKRSAVAL